MNTQQLEIMKLRIRPSLKLTMIAMSEWPEANREELSAKMNMDKTQLSTTTKRLENAELIVKATCLTTGHRQYKVLV